MAVMLGAGARQHAAAAKRDHPAARFMSIKGLHREADMLNYSIFLNSWKGED
jgi:hypothetical protein